MSYRILVRSIHSWASMRWLRIGPKYWQSFTIITRLLTKLSCEADSPLESWKVHDHSVYLDELLRHDGRAGESSCTFCGDDNGLYKCKECFGGRLHCKACIVQQHSSHPLHRIEVCAFHISMHWSHDILRNGTVYSSCGRPYAILGWPFTSDTKGNHVLFLDEYWIGSL